MQIALSPDAVAVLRFEIKGYRSKVPGSRLPAYRELAAAGIMEPVPGSDTDYRFTEVGMKHREEILEREAERIVGMIGGVFRRRLAHGRIPQSRELLGTWPHYPTGLGVNDVCEALQAGVADVEPEDLQGEDQAEADVDAEED